MSFTIPRKTVTPESFPDVLSDDTHLMDNLPDMLITSVKQYISKCNANTLNQIESLKINNEKNKYGYVQNISTTYNNLMSDIKNCFDYGKNLSHIINGEKYDSYYKQPTLEYWIATNEAKYTAVKIVIDQLMINGWKPEIAITEYGYDSDDGMYYRGDKLIVRCNFD